MLVALEMGELDLAFPFIAQGAIAIFCSNETS